MKIKSLLLAVLFSAIPGVLIASPVTYVMVTDDIYYNGSQITDASLVFRMTIDDKIRVYSGSGYSPDSPIVSLDPGDTLPTGSEYFNRVMDWSISFHGDLSELGMHKGDGGGFRWWIEDNPEGTKDWYDAWAHLDGEESNAQFPGFWWNWNFQDPNSGDYLLLPSSFFASGYFDGVGISGRFDPVPEPSGMILLLTTVCAWPLMKRTFRRKG